MPLIDGEKFACSSCIKGHRVSGCNHLERELHHINPKGRPVKQCEHCRGARKSKSHHAKCDCGDKKEKDKHKDKSDSKGHDNRCACHSGGKCICGIKKESTDLKLDTSKQTLHDARAKPKLTTTHSEPHLTVFANGHHKPCHRNNNTAHVSGAPYKIPRPHTLHGHSAFASLSMHSANYGKPEVSEQRSMDTLSLSNNDFYAMFGSSQSVFEGLPLTPLSGSLDTTAIQDSLFTSQSTPFGQEGNSPSESHLSDPLSNQWPWTTTVTPVNRNFAYGSLSTSPSQDCLPNLDSELSIPSAGFNPLWSAGDLPLDPSKLTDSLTQPISHSGESKHSVPGLSTASSSHSEVGEPTLFGDLDFKAPQSAASESLFWEDSPVYRLAASGPSENIAVPVSAPAMASTLDLDFAKSLSNVSAAMTSTTSPSDFGETGAIAIPNNLDEVSTNNPWMLDQTSAPFNGLPPYDMCYPNTWL